jgi:hypothetical protein
VILKLKIQYNTNFIFELTDSYINCHVKYDHDTLELTSKEENSNINYIANNIDIIKPKTLICNIDDLGIKIMKQRSVERLVIRKIMVSCADDIFTMLYSHHFFNKKFLEKNNIVYVPDETVRDESRKVIKHYNLSIKEIDYQGEIRDVVVFDPNFYNIFHIYPEITKFTLPIDSECIDIIIKILPNVKHFNYVIFTDTNTDEEEIKTKDIDMKLYPEHQFTYLGNIKYGCL